MDIAGAFDSVDHTRLLHILRTKGAPLWLVRWISSFLSDRSTCLSFEGQDSQQFNVQVSVPQGSPLSPILFLLYNSELVELCSRPNIGITATGFADDLNLLTYGTSTEGNCARLSEQFRLCEE